jgi:hypothetical protein
LTASVFTKTCFYVLVGVESEGIELGNCIRKLRVLLAP